jgi:hypothetical protein
MTATVFVTDKEQIVKAVLPLLPGYSAFDHERTVDYAMKTWWTNIRSTGGLGLSKYGADMFNAAGIESHQFEIGPSGSMSNIATSLVLNREMQCPYYFYSTNRKRYIEVYDSRIAMLILLCGDINEYIARLRDNNTENDND